MSGFTIDDALRLSLALCVMTTLLICWIINELKEKRYFIAVVGQIGAGKSSLINGLRNLKDSDPDAAPIEHTQEMKKYVHPTMGHLVLCEIPGAGAPGQYVNTYFKDHTLYDFDCFLVVSAERFMEVDFVVAAQALKLNKPCIFVRTKADQALKSIVRRKKITMLEASKQLRQIVKESFESNLIASGLPTRVDGLWKLFIVSAFAFANPGAIYVVKDDTSLEIGMDEAACLAYLSTLKKTN